MMDVVAIVWGFAIALGGAKEFRDGVTWSAMLAFLGNLFLGLLLFAVVVSISEVSQREEATWKKWGCLIVGL